MSDKLKKRFEKSLREFKALKDEVKRIQRDTNKGEGVLQRIDDFLEMVEMNKKLQPPVKLNDKELIAELRRNKQNINQFIAALRTTMRARKLGIEIGEGDNRIQLQLEDAYREYLAKYQLVEFLREYFNENEEKAPEKPEALFRKSKLMIIDYIFSNLSGEDIPKQLNFFDKYPRPSNIPAQIERKTGIARLTDLEAEELLNRQDYSNIYEGKNPLGKFEGKGKINLLEHQRKFLTGFFVGNLRSAIVYHGVGTGKTFSAVACCKLYLQLYPKGNVIVITPPAVLFNFIDSLAAYGVNPQDPRFQFLSYTKFQNNKTISTKDSLIIVDEAHNLRTEIIGSIQEEAEVEDDGEVSNKLKYDLKTIRKGKRPASLIIKGAEANKIVLLTATPFINSPYDIENLMAIGDSRFPLDKTLFGEKISSIDFRYDYFRYRISKYDRNFKKGDFPEMREKYVGLPVKEDDEKAKDLKALAGEENPFIFSISSNFFIGR